ncbi:putative toxin-antitoxin system toxin component, PIN family [Hymenobacter lapidiphilus]|uniref:putative toxin-antitoxin system toxin component, PIN family n=1 Tax=Hymenobacter sp. CCM 8763 TaxID=2303334 RepID=UPI000E349659|nr:putative toxin-antitoxin system toxin component, PIN family [Hymenobacter sp. CCM 8763]RFP64716.1 putative toxin-antitoxin system toxin component, PIN family [Hymenobacter sp. CCM 8763]
MRIVLDTNVLLASIGRSSPYRRVFTAIIQGEVDLLVSTSILLEYEEILTARTTAQVATSVVRALASFPTVHRYYVYYDWRLIAADPDDEKFVDCYVAGGGDYLVTNDRHFDVLAAISFPKIEVLSAEHFLHILR